MRIQKLRGLLIKSTLAYVTICFVNIAGIAWLDAQLWRNPQQRLILDMPIIIPCQRIRIV
tara:strand:+ start:87 stop:266 length:180 start_codon:yes stop_codon:yes gene_type:complete